MKVSTNQTTLPFAVGSETSREAAEIMEPSAANLRQLVLDVVARHPTGITCDAIEAITGLRHQTCSARVHELMKTGHILNSGRKENTRSGKGTKAILWILGSEGTVAAVARTKDKPSARKRTPTTTNPNPETFIRREDTGTLLFMANHAWVVTYAPVMRGTQFLIADLKWHVCCRVSGSSRETVQKIKEMLRGAPNEAICENIARILDEEVGRLAKAHGVA